MSFRDQIETTLRAIARDWRALETVSTLDDLDQSGIPSGADASVVRQLLDSVRRRAEVLLAQFGSAAVGQAQVLDGLSPDLVNFWREVIEPKIEKINSVWRRVMFPKLEDLFKDVNLDIHSTIPRTRDAYQGFLVALNSLTDTIPIMGVPEAKQMNFDEQNERAWKVLNSDYFEPDLWLDNQEELRPILLPSVRGGIPKEVRRRLRDVYRSALFCNWIAAIALSRAILEYTLLDLSRELKVDTRHSDPDKAYKLAELGTLVKRTAAVRRDLSEEMGFVVRWGNAVLHPSTDHKTSEILLQPKARDIAMRCVKHIRRIVEELYRLRAETK